MTPSRFFRRGRWDDERARELEAHLAIEIDENIARGMSPRDARDAARRKLGNTTLVREEIYQMNTMKLVDSAWRDLKFGARLLRLNPAFAIVAILSLALGVGANTAIFQLLDAVRIRTLPVRNASELAEVRIADPVDGRSGQFTGRRPSLTNPLWEQVRDRQQVFSEAFAWSSPTFDLTTGGEARYAQGLWVSGDFFNGLGVPALIGRVLTSADDRRGCGAPSAVLGYGFWQREYAGSPSVIGRSIMLDGHSFDIVGVTPASFFGVEVGRSFDVAVPLCAEPFSRGALTAMEKKDVWFLAAMGRLKPGVTIDQARSQLASISPSIFQATLPTYRPGGREALSAVQAGRLSGRDRDLAAEASVRIAALAAARDDGPRAADRLREPREPDARARDRAGAGARRSSRDRRLSRTHRAAAAGREPADRRDRRGGRRRPCPVAHRRHDRVADHRTTIASSSRSRSTGAFSRSRRRSPCSPA